MALLVEEIEGRVGVRDSLEIEEEDNRNNSKHQKILLSKSFVNFAGTSHKIYTKGLVDSKVF